MEGTPTIKSHRKLLQIIDTTLLQCYLHVSPTNSEGHHTPHGQNTQHNLEGCYMIRLELVPGHTHTEDFYFAIKALIEAGSGTKNSPKTKWMFF